MSAPGWLAVGYFLLWATIGLPDPYGFISLLSVLPLLPPLLSINRLAREDRSVMPSYARWRGRDVVYGLLFVGLMVLGTVAPDTRVVPGAQVLSRHMAFLEEMNIIERPEEVRYFYSPGFVSVRGEGTVLQCR